MRRLFRDNGFLKGRLDWQVTNKPRRLRGLSQISIAKPSQLVLSNAVSKYQASYC